MLKSMLEKYPFYSLCLVHTVVTTKQDNCFNGWMYKHIGLLAFLWNVRLLKDDKSKMLTSAACRDVCGLLSAAVASVIA